MLQDTAATPGATSSRSPTSWPTAIMDLPLALKDKQIAALFGVTIRTVQRWREQEKLPPKRFGLTPRDPILVRLGVIREAA